ncbi:hypothetical protein SeMB42_g02219 [Synchytrium endobioticum]|uniref:Pentacotripeptide-repeat region of PRORP domain-containing protein n=1 Tax=Synchytrium endobioticum TaxID=286115 RepID=A0A507D4W5_9FUNG|nr:hypothetical protein SeLEV6574_g03163 [Synchytrium endobioticum]TPX50501.1 hypothetical protein SeMB42_g02219 [Synchytrium endobioticum]
MTKSHPHCTNPRLRPPYASQWQRQSPTTSASIIPYSPLHTTHYHKDCAAPPLFMSEKQRHPSNMDMKLPRNPHSSHTQLDRPAVPSCKSVIAMVKIVRRALEACRPRLVWRLFTWLQDHGEPMKDYHTLDRLCSVLLIEKDATMKHHMLAAMLDYIKTHIHHITRIELRQSSKAYNLAKLELAIMDGQLDKIIRILSRMKQLDVHFEQGTKSRITTLAKQSLPEYEQCLKKLSILHSLKVIDVIPELKVATWCLDQGNLQGALFAVESFFTRNTPHTRHVPYPYLRSFINSVIHHACREGHIAWALSIHRTLSKYNIPHAAGMFSAMVSGLVRRGDVETACQIINQFHKSGLRPRNSGYGRVLNHYASQCDAANFQKVILEMTNSGFKPSAAPFAKMMDAEGKRGKPNYILQWYYMMKDLNVTPTAHVYNTMMSWWIATNDWQSYQWTWLEASRVKSISLSEEGQEHFTTSDYLSSLGWRAELEFRLDSHDTKRIVEICNGDGKGKLHTEKVLNIALQLMQQKAFQQAQQILQTVANQDISPSEPEQPVESVPHATALMKQILSRPLLTDDQPGWASAIDC